MYWNEKYLDNLEQLYWKPKYLGLKSISQKKWSKEGDFISVPRALVNESGPLYSRGIKSSEFKDMIFRQEEILNQFFDIAMSVVSGPILAQLLGCHGLKNPPDAFHSIGREAQDRYGFDGNFTRHDGFFVSKNCAVGVELKLGSKSSLDQIAKYLLMFVSEEKFSGRKDHMELTYIVPGSAVGKHWSSTGLSGATLSKDEIIKAIESVKGESARGLLLSKSEKVVDTGLRVKLEAISWSEFDRRMELVCRELNPKQDGDACLLNVLKGMRAQLRLHPATEVV